MDLDRACPLLVLLRAGERAGQCPIGCLPSSARLGKMSSVQCANARQTRTWEHSGVRGGPVGQRIVWRWRGWWCGWRRRRGWGCRRVVVDTEPSLRNGVGAGATSRLEDEVLVWLARAGRDIDSRASAGADRQALPILPKQRGNQSHPEPTQLSVLHKSWCKLLLKMLTESSIMFGSVVRGSR